MNRVIEPQFVCLDAGANLGPYSLVMSHLAAQGRVYAFEASRNTVELLKRNIKQNEIANVDVHHVAVSDRPGPVEFNYNSDLPGCSFVSATAFRLEEIETVEAITLDRFVEAMNLERLDVIKLDVEGSEVRTLRGSIELLQTFKPLLFVEYNPYAMRECQGLERH